MVDCTFEFTESSSAPDDCCFLELFLQPKTLQRKMRSKFELLLKSSKMPVLFAWAKKPPVFVSRSPKYIQHLIEFNFAQNSQGRGPKLQDLK